MIVFPIWGAGFVYLGMLALRAVQDVTKEVAQGGGGLRVVGRGWLDNLEALPYLPLVRQDPDPLHPAPLLLPLTPPYTPITPPYTPLHPLHPLTPPSQVSTILALFIPPLFYFPLQPLTSP